MLSFISPLSPRQKLIWSLLSRGLSVSEVARRLRTTPQYVHQTKRAAEAKLLRALMEAARASSIQIKLARPEAGILWGYHPGLRRDAIITYTARQGIKIWYWYDNPEEVTDQAFLNETREYLLTFAEERGIHLAEEEKKLHPAKLANIIFSRLLPGVKS